MSTLKIGTPGATNLQNATQDSSTYEYLKTIPKVTLKETFLPGFKVLEPLNIALPNPEEIMKISPVKRLIVGLSGVSCGGKTTMAKALRTWLGPKFGDVIMQDDYYLPANELPINPITNFPEFDEPESVRMNQIVNDILAWKNAPLKDTNEQTRVLVVDGTMIFTNARIAKLCDLRYNLHVDFKTAEYRRSLRNYPIPDPPLVVAKNIWPKYIKHRHMAAKLAIDNGYIFKQIDGTKKVEYSLAGIIKDVAVNKHR